MLMSCCSLKRKSTNFLESVSVNQSLNCTFTLSMNSSANCRKCSITFCDEKHLKKQNFNTLTSSASKFPYGIYCILRSESSQDRKNNQTITRQTYHLVQKSKAAILLMPTGARGRHRALNTSITLNTGQGILRTRIPRGINTRPEVRLLCLSS